MSFIIISSQFPNQLFFVIYVTIFETVKDLHKVPFPVLIYIKIGEFTIPITSNHRTPNRRETAGFCGEIEINKSVNHRLQVNYVNPLLYPFGVSDFPIPVRGVLCILIGDST